MNARYRLACVGLSVIICCLVAISPTTFAVEDEDNVYPLITAEQLKKLIDSKTTTIAIVDNAPKEVYAKGHIPGAINLPWAPELKPPVNLPSKKILILYCPCVHEEDSTDMAGKLREYGYYKVKLLKGGWFRWQALHYPIEKR